MRPLLPDVAYSTPVQDDILLPWPLNWAFDLYLYCDVTFTDPTPVFISRFSLFFAELLE